jgi:hypothetical protein
MRLGVGDGRLGRSASWLAGATFLAIALGSARVSTDPAASVYAVSFWHYYLYWLAYRYRAVPLAVFKRDAVLAKGVSLAALGIVYFSYPLAPLSLALVAGGFALNLLGAAALGPDRTYYGQEVGGLPPKRITAFPYSAIAHPMLTGNMIAFGATLLNDGFREDWWPLACGHLALNAGLLAMEVANGPAWRRAGPGLLAAAAAAGAVAVGRAGWPAAPILGPCALGYGYILYRRYRAPVSPLDNIQEDTSR